MSNRKVDMVIFTSEPIPENTIVAARSGNIPQFALKKTNVNKVLSNLKGIPKTNRAYSAWFNNIKTKIGQSLGLRKEWIQERPYMAVFTVNEQNVYRPIRNNNGRIRGKQNATNRTIIINASLEWPFIGTGKTLPLGSFKGTGLPHNGFNEYIIPPGTTYNSPAKSIHLGPYVKQLHAWEARIGSANSVRTGTARIGSAKPVRTGKARGSVRPRK